MNKELETRLLNMGGRGLGMTDKEYIEKLHLIISMLMDEINKLEEQ